MTPSQREIVMEVEALSKLYGLEAEIEVMKTLISEGEAIATIELMMHYRYELEVIEAFRAHMHEEERLMRI